MKKEREIISDYADLHTHTHRSDGALSPMALCWYAELMDVKHLAITDQDMVLDHGTFERIKKRRPNVDVVSGCEFSGHTVLTDGTEVTVHVTGLWLPTKEDEQPEVLKRVLKTNRQDYEPYAKAMLEKLLACGVDPSGKGVDESFRMLTEHHPETFHLGKNAVADLLIDTGCVSGYQEAMQRYLGAFGERRAYVDGRAFFHYANLKDVIAAANVGVSVLCHLFYYDLTPAQNEELLEQCVSLGIQGLEVDCGRYTDEQQVELLGYCRRYGLLPVPGSDYHYSGYGDRLKYGEPEWFHALLRRCEEMHGSDLRNL